MLNKFAVGLISSFAVSSGAAFAQGDQSSPASDPSVGRPQLKQNVIYGGLGSSNDSDSVVDSMPFVVGFLHQPAASQFVFGFDLAGEGEMLDSTYGGNEVRQALSYNLLLGSNLMRDGNFRLDAGVLVGLRESFADCPDSFLGYQCYADEAPDTEYDANFGAFIGVSFDGIMLGLRGTGESAQGLLGFRF